MKYQKVNRENIWAQLDFIGTQDIKYAACKTLFNHMAQQFLVLKTLPQSLGKCDKSNSQKLVKDLLDYVLISNSASTAKQIHDSTGE